MSITTGSIIISILFLGVGILSVSASIFNWDWFFKSANAQLITGHFSRKWARIFYLGVGILAISIATHIFITLP